MAKTYHKVSRVSVVVLVFLVLVLVTLSYFLATGKLVLYKSGAAGVYTAPNAQIVGGSNKAQIVGGSNLKVQVKATLKPVAKPTTPPKKSTAY
jgi:hypothetical protein